MSLVSRSSVAAAVKSGSGDAEIPLETPLDEVEFPLPRSRLKMEGSEVDLDDVELEDDVDWTATTEAAMAVVVAGTFEEFLCSLRSRSQKR